MDMQKILEYRNARNRFCQRIGITVTELSPGYAKVVKTVTEDDLNPVDVAHGGLFFSMADNAAGSAMAAYGRTGGDAERRSTTSCAPPSREMF